MKPRFFSLARALVVITAAALPAAMDGVADAKGPAFSRAVLFQEVRSNRDGVSFQELEGPFAKRSGPSQFLAFDTDSDDPVSLEEPDEVEACAESPSGVSVALHGGGAWWTARQG